MTFKHKQKENFDNHHHTRDAPEIPSDAEVWPETRVVGSFLSGRDNSQVAPVSANLSCGGANDIGPW